MKRVPGGIMKKRTISFVVLAAALVTMYGAVDFLVEPPALREPASVPNNYENLKGCEKQNILWDKISQTTYSELPDFRNFGAMQLMGMARQEVALKGKNISDFAPEGWKKFLHGRASIAKVKIVPTNNNKYTGIFQGSECGLLRLSITFKPTATRGVAPGLALKILRDGVYSANVSALVSLGGQGKEYNLFRNSMSNIVPTGTEFGQKMVHKIFSSASKYPEELKVADMAEIDSHGTNVRDIVAPRQLFFVPNPDFRFSSEPHDVRTDFATIPSGTQIYQIYAVNDKYKNFDYANYGPENVTTLLADSEHIANIVSTSEFKASAFGDDGIFFRHELRTSK
jgi:hypothetical protein